MNKFRLGSYFISSVLLTGCGEDPRALPKVCEKALEKVKQELDLPLIASEKRHNLSWMTIAMYFNHSEPLQKMTEDYQSKYDDYKSRGKDKKLAKLVEGTKNLCEEVMK